MDIVGGSRPLAEQRGGDSPRAEFANCALHNFFLYGTKKALSGMVAQHPATAPPVRSLPG